MSASKKLQRIAWPVRQGYRFTDIDEIAYCKAEGSYTHIHLCNGTTFLLSQKIKTVEMLLPELPFMRVHPSYMVNLDCAKSLLREDGELFLEVNGTKVPVAKTRRKVLLEGFRVPQNKMQDG